ncbi:MAG: rod shape-determining protein MreD [Rudaea sp.]|uniref:rod shape-determining protein MreD n=1 Tax=unclassified Rudaea TaxID=2627037 RepID=UPI0010F4C7AC|nr:MULTISPECIES: rod shape-determining protein MreD [unclassified Rudaea]MBN8886966.1 rod shape-determining protein MreD [Rudaea sp.]MBR0343954.1 rod shape-determining protein MreD [Rudaea sp.]
MRVRGLNWLFLGGIVASFVLQLMPLPAVLLPFKPYWLALVLIYWMIELPEKVPLGLCFALGIVADLVGGEVLGEQAMRLCILCFIVLRFRSRLRFFPMWQQTLAVFALLLNDRIVYLMVHAIAGDPPPDLDFWFAPVAGMLAWPWLFLLLDDLRARLRAGDT